MVLGEYNNETIVLMGISGKKFGKVFNVSSDFVDIEIITGEQSKYILETSGKLTILKLDDAVRLIESLSDEAFFESSIYSYVILHNYTGSIKLEIYDSEGERYKFNSFNAKSLTTRFKDYTYLELLIEECEEIEFNNIENFDYVI